MNKLYSEIKSWLNTNKESMISDTISTLQIDSESYNRSEVGRALRRVLEIAQKLGFKTELRANGEVGVVFFGEGDETLGILTHVDVVPAGDPALWSHSPYGELHEGKIYGRGIVDNKGMVISSLYAMAAVKALNMPIYKKTELIIGTREEITWDDLVLYKKEGHDIPDYGFTPDGEFPIINREKGNCEIHIVFRGIESSGDFKVLDLKSGEAVNSVPGKAKARIKGNIDVIKSKIAEYNKKVSREVFEFQQINPQEAVVTAKGKEVHSSLPEHGDNAMTSMCRLLSQLKLSNTAVDKFIKFIIDHFNNNYYGDSLGLPKHPEYHNGEEMGKTTAVPSMAFLDNDMHLYLSIRTVFGTEKQEIKDAFDKLGNDYDFSYSFSDYLDPLYVSKEHKFIEILSKVYEEITKEKAEFILAGGTTYAKALPNSVAFGPIFPGDCDVAHQIDENIEIDKLMKVTEIYAMVIAEVMLNIEALK